ncbi:MAG: flippase-like domain-containing protein [Actinobacteria bacterium]|nr:flippase-like domain-containing protein [Actinomycetota bacterium]
MKHKFVRVLPAAIALFAIAAAGLVIVRDRHELSHAVSRLGIAVFVGSELLAVAAVVVVALVWRTILGGLNAPTRLPEALRVFLVSQLGKYLPGSIWPVVAQMEFGRRQNIPRRTMLAANVLTLAVTVTVGLVMAAVLLPFSSAGALHRYWWTLILLPPLLVSLHPKVVPALLNVALRTLRREPITERLDWRSTVVAIGWGALSWLLFGLHLYVIIAALGATGGVAVCAAIGGLAFAVACGIAFIPAPAGAGVRDVVLLLTLTPLLGHDDALAASLASRVLLVLADIVGAGTAALLPRVRSRPAVVQTEPE